MLRLSGPIRKTFKLPAACRQRYVPLAHRGLAGWVEQGVVHAGVSELVPGYHVGTDQQESFLLIATTGGRGIARTGQGGTHDLAPGTLLIHGPRDPREWATAAKSWTLVWWYLADQPRWRALAAGGPRVVPFAHGELLKRSMDALIRRLGESDPTKPSPPVAARLADLVLAHLRELAGEAPAAADDELGPLWAEVSERLHEPWPLAHLAARLRVSVPTLQRRVRARHGRSAHQVLLGLRMARAEELLRRTDYPLRVIAEQLGFADQFGFSSAFRRHRGCAPSVFRQRVGSLI
jgi:AraC-like DNA-binding protein